MPQNGEIAAKDTAKIFLGEGVIMSVPFMKICCMALINPYFSRKEKRERDRLKLPAGFGDTGDHPVGCQFPESDTGELKSADESTTTSRNQATIREADRASIPGKLAESEVVFLCLELSTEFRPLRHGSEFAFVTFKP